VGCYFKRFQQLTPLQQTERVSSYVSWKKRLGEPCDGVQALWDSNKLPKKAIVWDTKAGIIKDIVLATPPPPPPSSSLKSKPKKQKDALVVSSEDLAKLHGRIIVEVANWRSQNVHKKTLFNAIHRYTQCLLSFRSLTATVVTQQIQQAIDRIVKLSEKYPMEVIEASDVVE
ncbi:hypothetical protein HK102_003444, partial [Quaeritorhiza haematococci]